jgi:hypothetical protein
MPSLLALLLKQVYFKLHSAACSGVAVTTFLISGNMLPGYPIAFDQLKITISLGYRVVSDNTCCEHTS